MAAVTVGVESVLWSLLALLSAYYHCCWRSKPHDDDDGFLHNKKNHLTWVLLLGALLLHHLLTFVSPPVSSKGGGGCWRKPHGHCGWRSGWILHEPRFGSDAAARNGTRNVRLLHHDWRATGVDSDEYEHK